MKKLTAFLFLLSLSFFSCENDNQSSSNNASSTIQDLNNVGLFQRESKKTDLEINGHEYYLDSNLDLYYQINEGNSIQIIYDYNSLNNALFNANNNLVVFNADDLGYEMSIGEITKISENEIQLKFSYSDRNDFFYVKIKDSDMNFLNEIENKFSNTENLAEELNLQYYNPANKACPPCVVVASAVIIAGIEHCTDIVTNGTNTCNAKLNCTAQVSFCSVTCICN